MLMRLLEVDASESDTKKWFTKIWDGLPSTTWLPLGGGSNLWLPSSWNTEISASAVNLILGIKRADGCFLKGLLGETRPPV